jgi:hypothetical protein
MMGSSGCNIAGEYSQSMETDGDKTTRCRIFIAPKQPDFVLKHAFVREISNDSDMKETRRATRVPD